MVKFNEKAQKELGHYVYGLIDPVNKEIFYVGKASSNNRPFDHLKLVEKETKAKKKIEQIRSNQNEPIIEILRYGLETKEMAFEVEAAIIDAIGLEYLTNNIRGHGIKRGRLSIQEIMNLHGAEPICINSIDEQCIMFFINKTYSTSLDEIELYDATRQFWGVRKEMVERQEEQIYKVALSIYDSVVVRVYSIIKWYKAGDTFSTRPLENNENRYEFIGNLKSGHSLLGKMLVDEKGNPIKANQKGFGYIN